jgi:hypothetical protein
MNLKINASKNYLAKKKGLPEVAKNPFKIDPSHIIRKLPKI